MKLLLRLLITADWPSQDASCEWALVDVAGKPLQRGHSEPRHWPAADECEIILSAEQCLLLAANLPKGAKSRLPEVISYALEDQLIGDADADHFVAGDRDADRMTPVWVVSRARLKVLLAALNSVARGPRRACGEIQLAPLRSGHWSVCLREQAGGGPVVGFVRTGTEAGLALSGFGEPSAINTPPLELQLALQAARAGGSPPAAIALYGVPGTDAESARVMAASWQAVLAIPVTCAGDYIWHEDAAAARTARNLLTQDFAPPRRAQDGLGSFRPALLLALAAGILFALFSVGEWIWLARVGGQLQQQMAATFRTAFPQSQASAFPPLQMQRLYDQLRREQGQLGATDFLPLLATATESMAGLGTLSKLGYEDGRLEFTLMLAKGKSAEAMRDLAKSRGLAVTLRDVIPGKDGVKGVQATVSLRSAP